VPWVLRIVLDERSIVLLLAAEAIIENSRWLAGLISKTVNRCPLLAPGIECPGAEEPFPPLEIPTGP
jgi:hypothetical protein